MRWAVIALVVGLVVVAAYSFATGLLLTPRPTEWLTKTPIAHRGQWTSGPARPENSLAAFDEAAENGFAVELDVHHTKDGVVVVVHDEELETVTDEPGLIGELTLTEVKQRRLLGGAETIPTLEEALALIGGRVPVFVEIKNDGEVGALEDDVAAELQRYDGDAAVMSFNPYSLARIASAAPELPRGQLSGSFEGEDLKWYEVFLLKRLLMNWTSRPDFVAYELEELPSVHTTLQRLRGRALLGWTIESVAERESAQGLVDGVIADPAGLPQ